MRLRPSVPWSTQWRQAGHAPWFSIAQMRTASGRQKVYSHGPTSGPLRGRMKESLKPVTDLLELFLEEDDKDALVQACKIAVAEKVDGKSLMDWLQHFRCDPAAKVVAMRTLRSTLKLPLLLGPASQRSAGD